MVINHTKDYPLSQEIASSIIHGVGALAAMAALVILIIQSVRCGTVWHIVSFIIYGITLIILYTSSTFYHALAHRGAKNVFARMDHAAIFLLIAGTYTPFMLTSLRGVWGWSIFTVIWIVAITGVVIRSIYLSRFYLISTIFYVLMGWSFLIAYRQIILNIPAESLRLLVYGGISYTIGVIFYVWRKLPFNHAIWHLFVLMGSVLHFLAVVRLV